MYAPSSANFKLACLNLGCRVNRVELDDMATQFLKHGYTLTNEEDAHIVVINTCAVTGEAQAKTRKAVRHATNLAQQPYVIATGCAASLFADELNAISARVYVEPNKDKVLSCVELISSRITEGTRAAVAHQELSSSEDLGHKLSCSITPTGRTRPGIKVQDGCDNRCSFCIVWQARGPSRSLPYEEVVQKVQQQIEMGAHEVVLTGINLGCYQDKGRKLEGLLSGLLQDTNIDRIRLSSVEPQDISEEIAELIASSKGRIAPYVHMPLQSGCDATLRRMARLYTAQDYACKVAMLRDCVPSIAIACDFIVGFPGESDAEFKESLDFCKQMAFSHMHVFRYSPRPGTPAAQAPHQVDGKLSQFRAKTARDLALKMRECAIAQHVGMSERVVVQESGKGITGGLYEACIDEALPIGSIVDVRVHGLMSTTILDCRTPPSSKTDIA